MLDVATRICPKKALRYQTQTLATKANNETYFLLYIYGAFCWACVSSKKNTLWTPCDSTKTLHTPHFATHPCAPSAPILCASWSSFDNASHMSEGLSHPPAAVEMSALSHHPIEWTCQWAEYCPQQCINVLHPANHFYWSPRCWSRLADWSATSEAIHRPWDRWWMALRLTNTWAKMATELLKHTDQRRIIICGAPMPFHQCGAPNI